MTGSWWAPAGLALSLPVAWIGAAYGSAKGAAAGVAAAAVYGGLLVWTGVAGPLSAAACAALLTALGAASGEAAAREGSKRLGVARGVWTSLRAGQVSEFLSYVLYQLREYQVSATSLIEALALSAPKENAPQHDRIERLRRVIAELNFKSARLLGENSALTTQSGRPSSFALGELVRDAAAEARLAFSTADVSVSIVEQGTIPALTCDRKALRLTLLAVLQNALEACSAKGQGAISIVLRQRDKTTEIELVDDGGGLSDSATLFEPFFAARVGSGGLGLGLPMARRMTERLGGTLRVKSQNGATAVLLELPTARDLPKVRNEESTWAGRRKDI